MRELSELVEAAQSGDSEAYDALIQRFQQMAYATAYRYLGDHHLAQDLVQEASLEAFVHLSQLKEPGAFPGWFRQIVFRQCTRVLRQVTLQYTSLEAVSDGLLAESNPEDIAVQGEVQACVRLAVASLPQHERLVTVLFYGCRYSYNEVSALLKIPLTTVKKRLHSARRKLKVQLQASLHDTIENARRASDGAEGAEICLARWWSWLMRCVKAKHASWQTSRETREPHEGDRVRATARVAPTYRYVGAGLAPARRQGALKRISIRRRCYER
jgi:RNA polymerase sigma factor (sigma-70 family)